MLDFAAVRKLLSCIALHCYDANLCPVAQDPEVVNALSGAIAGVQHRKFRESIFADAQQLSTQLERLLHPLFRMSNMQATTVIRQSYVFVCVLCVSMHMHNPICVQEVDTTRPCS